MPICHVPLCCNKSTLSLPCPRLHILVNSFFWNAHRTTSKRKGILSTSQLSTSLSPGHLDLRVVYANVWSSYHLVYSQHDCQPWQEITMNFSWRRTRTLSTGRTCNFMQNWCTNFFSSPTKILCYSSFSVHSFLLCGSWTKSYNNVPSNSWEDTSNIDVFKVPELHAPSGKRTKGLIVHFSKTL